MTDLNTTNPDIAMETMGTVKHPHINSPFPFSLIFFIKTTIRHAVRCVSSLYSFAPSCAVFLDHQKRKNLKASAYGFHSN